LDRQNAVSLRGTGGLKGTKDLYRTVHGGKKKKYSTENGVGVVGCLTTRRGKKDSRSGHFGCSVRIEKGQGLWYVEMEIKKTLTNWGGKPSLNTIMVRRTAWGSQNVLNTILKGGENGEEYSLNTDEEKLSLKKIKKVRRGILGEETW